MTKFYAAEITSAFIYLHSKSIVYRDLKPENVLINKDGHLKLVDFGFVKTLKSGQKTYTMCGTPEYLAPEIVMQVGHSFAVDWWTLGIFIYELLMGTPPFADDSPHKVYKRILDKDVKMPENLDDCGIVRQLLEKNPNNRLCADKIKTHEFFKDISWRDVEKLRLEAPFVPKLNGNDDSSYFGACLLYASDAADE